MITQTTQTTQTLGKLLISRDGYTGGPRYGEIYTAPAGARGIVAGYRDRGAGNALYGQRWFATLAEAEDYLCARHAY